MRAEVKRDHSAKREQGCAGGIQEDTKLDFIPLYGTGSPILVFADDAQSKNLTLAKATEEQTQSPYGRWAGLSYTTLLGEQAIVSGQARSFSFCLRSSPTYKNSSSNKIVLLYIEKHRQLLRCAFSFVDIISLTLPCRPGKVTEGTSELGLNRF